jgi:hypothetical protein
MAKRGVSELQGWPDHDNIVMTASRLIHPKRAASLHEMDTIRRSNLPAPARNGRTLTGSVQRRHAFDFWQS